MRKVIYLLWLDTSDEGWSRTLHHDLVPALQQVVGVGRVQLNIADGDVAPAAALRMQSSSSLFDAMCCVWLDDALAADSLDELIQRISVQFSRYHVDEVERLANTKHRAEPGVRLSWELRRARAGQPPLLQERRVCVRHVRPRSNLELALRARAHAFEACGGWGAGRAPVMGATRDWNPLPPPLTLA